MADGMQKYWSYVRLVKRLLAWSGLSSTIKDLNNLHTYSPIFIIVTCTIMALACTNFCRQNYTNLDLFTKGVTYMGSVTTVILKAVIFFLCRDRIKTLNGNLEELFEVARRKESLRPALLQLLRHFYCPCYFFALILTLLFLLYSFLPLIFIGIQASKNVEQKKCILPYPSKFPWSIEGCGWSYQLHFAFEFFSGWFVSYVSAGVDILFGYYVLRICFVLRALSNDLEDEHCNDDLMRGVLAKHKRLLYCCKILQSIYGPIVFWMALTSAFQLCALIFQLFQTKLTVGKVLQFVCYAITKLAQTFMYSWYGTLLTVESEKFQQSAYSSRWYLVAYKSFSQGVLLILRQRPIKFTAVKFFPISVDLFLGILNTTISYFFLLRTMDDAK